MEGGTERGVKGGRSVAHRPTDVCRNLSCCRLALYSGFHLSVIFLWRYVPVHSKNLFLAKLATFGIFLFVFFKVFESEVKITSKKGDFRENM